MKVVNKYEMVMEKVAEYPYDMPIYEPAAVVGLLNKHMKLNKRPEEHVVVISLDIKGDLIGLADISIGGLCANIVEPRAIFRQAIMQNAAFIIIAHNHPSGSIEPSDEDIALTKSLKQGGDLLHIPLKDHIIIGDGFTSLHEMLFC